MLKPNTLTQRLGIHYPIIQAPMAGGVTTPALVAAVSNAGGLGSLGAGYMSPSEIKNTIAAIREQTNKPFAVNLFIPEKHSATAEQMQIACDDIQQCCIELNLEINPTPAPYAQSFEMQIQIVYEEKVPVFSFTFGMLSPTWIDRLKSNGTALIGTATSLQEAHALEKSGIDMICLQGLEAGGHRGTFLGKPEDALIDLASLITQCAGKIYTPLIAAGSITTGRDIASVIYLGASAAQIGTAFLTCHESGISTQYKDILLSQTQDNTTLTRAISGKLARGIQNKFTRCMENKLVRILDYPIQNALTQSMRKKAKEIGATDFMSLWAGQNAAHCRKLSAHELVHTLIAEANDSL